MATFAIIDTETNWNDRVMSIGTVIADADTFRLIDAKYHILTPEYLVGGMYSDTLFTDTGLQPLICSRKDALVDLIHWFSDYEVHSVFAYNASFDRNHLPELKKFDWHDIMRLAAYRQFNKKIPCNADCFATGRLKRGYGVEAMLRLLSNNHNYHESHNAYFDALDELSIMTLLEHPLVSYPKLP